MANEENSETLWLWRPLSLYSAVASRLQATAAAFSGGVARLHATCEVVAGDDDLEVVDDEGAHVAVGGGKVAVYYLGIGMKTGENWVLLRLVGLHHGEVSLGALDRRSGRTVLLPP